tara:strand:+ start:1355 stop:1489 length:135 start_codon:yes stop_codon:yes gene_type:complete
MLKKCYNFLIEEIKDLYYNWLGNPFVIGISIVLLSLLIFEIGIG